MWRRNLFLSSIFVIALGLNFVDSKPAKGTSEASISDGSPALVAESDKTSHYIGKTDVLTCEERAFLKAETKSKANLFILNQYSGLTDLTENYLNELASNGKCENEITTLGACLQNRGDKATINTLKVSLTQKSDIKQVSFTNSEGETITVDDDCTNNQISLEKCIIENNRYYPCAPPSRDLTKFKDLFEKRSAGFAEIIKGVGYKLLEKTQKFDFGESPGYEILNYDEFNNFDKLSRDFLANVPQNKLSEPFESLKKGFIKVHRVMPKDSNDFKRLIKAFKNVACEKKTPSGQEVFNVLEKSEKKLKKKKKDPSEAFEGFKKSFNDFIAQFPSDVQETCGNEAQHQAHITGKVQLLELLGVSC